MLEIDYLDEVDSTHLRLLELLKTKRVSAPYAISAERQNGGIGSRGNRWEGMEGNLFLSFCLKQSTLPADLPKQSMSIYFSFVLKEILAEFGSRVWLKWPNDFYIEARKVGGTITTVISGDTVVCSIGLNLKKAPKEFAVLDVPIDKKQLLDRYFLRLKEELFWKDIFRKFRVEFLQSTEYNYFDQAEKKRISLKHAKLQEDGSILLENRRIYSLR